MSAQRGLAEAMRAELARAGVRLPVVADTGQAPVEEPVALARRGASTWLVDYRAAEGLAPMLATPAWTEHASGEGSQEVADGLLTVTAAGEGDALYNCLALSDLDSDRGTLLEARLRVAASGSGVNGGACMAVFDGRFLSVAWLRGDGLNLDGSPDVPVTLGDAPHRVSLHVLGETVRVFVDGELKQTGRPVAGTTLKAAAFGSWVEPEP